MWTLLVCVWLASVAVFAVAHDHPEKIEELTASINLKTIEVMQIPLVSEKAVRYEVYSGILAIVLPLLFFISACRSQSQAGKLRNRLSQERREMETAKAILRFMGEAGKELDTKMQPKKGETLRDGITQLEQELKQTTARVAQLEEAQTDDEKLSNQLSALSTALSEAKRRYDAVQKRKGVLAASLQEVTTAHEELGSNLDELEEDDPTGTVESMETDLTSLRVRIEALETLPSRVIALKQALNALDARRQEVDPDEEEGEEDEDEEEEGEEDEDEEEESDDDESTLIQQIENLGTAKKELESALGDIEDAFGDSDLDSWETDVNDFETRIATIETTLPRVLVLQTKISALTTRLENANGVDDDTLAEVTEAVVNDRNALETELEEVEGAVDEDDLKGWENNVTDFETRITALEALLPRVSEVKKSLPILNRRIERVNGGTSGSLADMASAIDELDKDISEVLDGMEREVTEDKVSEWSESAVTVQNRIAALEQLAQQAASLKQEFKNLEKRADNLQDQDLETMATEISGLAERVQEAIDEK